MQKNLIDWFLEEKRDLPWRENKTPYSVWISEVMLQQTQASTVTEYFYRWMKQFPTINDLAQAPLEEVIKCFEGLGYYSRARNLHLGAKYIQEHFQGQFPNNEEDIDKIKGIGPYTKNAILAFAFEQKKAAVDGNVLRVITRIKNIEEDICLGSTKKQIQAIADTLLPSNDAHIFSEALIELGATICKKKPMCEDCPIRYDCLAFKKGNQNHLPKKTKKIIYEQLYREVAIIMMGQTIALIKREDDLMKDLFEFPYLNATQEIKDTNLITQDFEKELLIPLIYQNSLENEKQSFTKYRVELRAHLFVTNQSSSTLTFFPIQECSHLPFSSGHKRILKKLLSHIKKASIS